MAGSDLVYKSAAELGRLIRDRAVSPVDVVQAYLDRIQEVDDRLHAYITVCAEEALEAARGAEAAIARGDYLGPMHGIPVAVKDQWWTKGVRTTAGSTILEDFVPEEDATVMARLKEAGGIFLGKTNLTEFAVAWPYRYPHGTPTNPWDLSRMPGGSSAGSASAVSAGLCATALGEDTGGSIRGPASYCGVAGLRPTWGRVSRYGLLGSAWSFDSIGPMARAVEDCAVTLAAIAGHDPGDPYTWDVPVPDYTASLNGDIRDIRVGVVTEGVDSEAVEPETRDAVTRAIGVIKGLGATVQEVSIPMLPYSGTIYMGATLLESATIHYENIRHRQSEYDHNMQVALLTGSLIPSQTYYKSQRLRQVLRQQTLSILEQVDVLVLPTEGAPAPPIIDRLGFGNKADVKASLVSDSFTEPANLVGLPALSVPCGFSSGNFPLGLQVMGRAMDEASVFRVGYAYQEATDWHTRRPPI